MRSRCVASAGRALLGTLTLAALLATPLAVAAPFCAVTPNGNDCRFLNFAACLKAVGPGGRCVTNQAELRPPLGKGRYCVVTAHANQCLYDDLDACRNAASASGGSCMVRNP